MHQLEEIRAALSRHPVVALVGARGTGKTALGNTLAKELGERGVTVVRLDAKNAESPYDLNAPLAEVLRCRHEELSASELPEDVIVRVVVDDCHEFFDRTWFPYLQEQWRALVTSEEARGRIGILLLGRPLFRAIAGGEGSPLLGVGPLLVTRPLSTDEIRDSFGVSEGLATATRRKTGGHPSLTRAFLAAVDDDIAKIGGAVAAFLREQERYLVALAQDHGLAALGMLADVARVDGPCAASQLTKTHYGSHFAAGQEALRDLEGSGLIAREGEDVVLAAEMIRSVPALREFIRAPTLDIPAEPSRHQALAAAELFRVENRLRSFIHQTLGAVDPAWWPARIPDDFVGAAELRRRAELDSAVAPDGEPHPIYYLSLGELFEIVLMNENWNRVFAVAVRHTREMFRAASEDLLAVRNKVAHSRPVSDRDLQLLGLAAERIGLGG